MRKIIRSTDKKLVKLIEKQPRFSANKESRDSNQKHHKRSRQRNRLISENKCCSFHTSKSQTDTECPAQSPDETSKPINKKLNNSDSNNTKKPPYYKNQQRQLIHPI